MAISRWKSEGKAYQLIYDALKLFFLFWARRIGSVSMQMEDILNQKQENAEKLLRSLDSFGTRSQEIL